jgi:hypothetical protein
MKKLGDNPNQFESFIIEVYQYSQRIGLIPQDTASNFQALINLSKDIPFSKIPEHIEEKKKEISRLDEEIRKRREDIKSLEERKDTLEMETSTAKELCDAALENEKTTTAKIREYSNFKTELGKYDILIEDNLPKSVQLLYEISQRGYDVEKVLSEYLDLLFIKENRDIFWRQIDGLKHEKMNLQNECSFLKAEVSRHRQRLYTYDELESMGLGIRELRILCNAIKEIAAENGIRSYKIAIDQFFEWVEKLYGDIKLRQKINQQKEEQLKYAKPDNLPTTYPYYSDVQPFNLSPERSTLEERERELKMPSTKYYRYWETNTTNYKTTREEEENDQSDNDNNNKYDDIYDG